LKIALHYIAVFSLFRFKCYCFCISISEGKLIIFLNLYFFETRFTLQILRGFSFLELTFQYRTVDNDFM
jgi:hypothetical protein